MCWCHFKIGKRNVGVYSNPPAPSPFVAIVTESTSPLWRIQLNSPLCLFAIVTGRVIRHCDPSPRRFPSPAASAHCIFPIFPPAPVPASRPILLREVIEPGLELVGSQAHTLFCQPALTRNPHSGSQAWNFDKKSKILQKSKLNCQKIGCLRHSFNSFKIYFLPFIFS